MKFLRKIFKCLAGALIVVAFLGSIFSLLLSLIPEGQIFLGVLLMIIGASLLLNCKNSQETK